jgi:hypothetical protein
MPVPANGRHHRREKQMTQASSDSLITDEMRARIGVKSPGSRLEIDKTMVRLFARAVGHTDPVYYDEGAAKAAGYRSLPCPPGYMGTPVFNPRARQADLGPMSLPDSPVKLTRILNGGTEYEYLGDICAGDVLTSTSYISDLAEREGSIGRMLIVTSKTDYTNQDGKLVAISTGTLIRY